MGGADQGIILRSTVLGKKAARRFESLLLNIECVYSARLSDCATEKEGVVSVSHSEI